MLKNKYLRLGIILIIIIVNVGCDQISKNIVREKVYYGETIEIVDDKFILTKVENTGAFLSLGDELPLFWKNILLLGLPAIMLLVAFGFVYTQKDMSKFGLAGLCFVIGGGIGNMIDRWLYGSVTDFFQIDLGGVFKTGIFNMADVSIMVGLGFMILHYWMEEKEKKPPLEVKLD